MYVVLIGAPGSGKGTQAGVLAETSGLAHVASGDLFRAAVQQGTELGRVARGYMERGELVPDEVTIAMIMERLREPDTARGVILDGFPRTVEQAQALDRALAARDQQIDLAIYLRVPTEVLLRRLSGRWICRVCQATYHEVFRPPATPGQCDACGGELSQRPDDRLETAERRLQVYFEQTLPAIEYYRRRRILVEVDGNQPIEPVAAEMLGALGQTTR
ncbi:MAG: adenylate kinase [Chloroflexi bacterium]|nr:adenylate kinase [Chloroflexota bacterium]